MHSGIIDSEVGVLKGTEDWRALNRPGHDRHQGTEPDSMPREVSPGSADGFCLNTVELRVEPHESFRRVSQFVRALGLDFRRLQMVGNYKEGLAIRLAVRRAVRPEEVIKKLDGVSQVDVPRWVDSGSPAQVLRVCLTE